ncbi:hypothetical protein E4Z61_03110 [Citrobacter tructae]|uniref:Uncharacterized protein n=1 Tax=Citrobacter tructae TaxID=2562449 RepID=A0ABX5T1L5_9ENTR|nr:hypothetical protein E4Z61_03110 [Citrobacter tructae]
MCVTLSLCATKVTHWSGLVRERSRILVQFYGHAAAKPCMTGKMEWSVNIPMNLPRTFRQVTSLRTGEQTNGSDGVLPAGKGSDYLRGKDTDRG